MFVAVVLPFRFAVPVTTRFWETVALEDTARFDERVVLPVTPNVVPTVAAPETPSEVSVPSDVTLGCAAVASVPYKRFADKLPSPDLSAIVAGVAALDES